MRIGLDSTNPDAIMSIIKQGHNIDGWLILGYVNGPRSAWPAAKFSEFAQRGIQVARIDVDGSRWKDASILDVEKYDVQDPATITRWVRNRSGNYGGDAIVYCNQSNLPLATSAAAAAGVPCGIWLAKLGNPPLDPAAVGVSLPANLYLAGVQFQWTAHYDVSMWFRDDWHPELADPGQAHAKLVNQAYTLTDPVTAAAVADDVSRETPPDPTQSSTPPDGSEASSESASPGQPTPTPTSSSADPTTTPGPSSGESASPMTTDPQMAPASAGASSTPSMTPPPAAGGGGVAGEIENLIGKAKTGISDLSGLLHSQGFHDAAHRLEVAIGEAIQLAGLFSKITGL